MVVNMKDYRANKIFGNIYQGPVPPTGEYLQKAGIHTVVLCAKELQFNNEGSFPGVNVIRAPSIDTADGPPQAEWTKAWHTAAKRVAELSVAGHRVLVTCHAGLNRSGVVSALAIHYITGFPGDRCCKIVQMSRKGALFNDKFVAYLNEIPERIVTPGPVQIPDGS